jgi:hypothetical protein
MSAIPVPAPPRSRRAAASALLALGLFLLATTAQAYTRNNVLNGPDGRPITIQGTVVVIEPDIELSEVLAGGVAEPRQAWTETARRLYPEAVRQQLAAASIQQRPDYDVPDELDPDSRLGQVLRLNEAVSLSAIYYSSPGSQLATKGDRLDWTLGPGVEELRNATGADYALFTYIRDSYTSGGRGALRVAAFLLLGADIGGGSQVGVATLVDLRTGQVVWFNLLARQTGDLRDPDGAAATVRMLLREIPL